MSSTLRSVITGLLAAILYYINLIYVVDQNPDSNLDTTITILCTVLSLIAMHYGVQTFRTKTSNFWYKIGSIFGIASGVIALVAIILILFN